MIRQERDSVAAKFRRPLVAAMLLLGLAATVLLYLVSRANYPLFHSIVDTVTVFVAGSVFLVVWHGRRHLDNNYYLFIAIAFLAFAVLDFMHIVGNKGMGVFPQYGNLGPTFYIASRYVLGVSFLLAPLFIKRKVNAIPVFAVYLLVVVLVLLSVLHWRNFPTTYVEGTGLTAFKVYSDYAVCLMLLGGLGLLVLNRRAFDPRVFKIIALSLVLSIGTGLAFTLYTDAFGITNAVGHFFQIASFYLVYLAFVQTALTKPQDILYRNLNDSEERLRLFIDHAPAALAMFDRQMRYLSVSRRWLKDYRLEDREVRGLCHYDVFPQISEEWRQAHRRGLAGEVVRADEDVFERGDGSTLWLRWEVRPWQDGSGHVAGIVIFTEDITERKLAEQEARRQQEWLRVTLTSIGDAVMATDAEGKIVFMNPVAERLMGWRQQDALGLPAQDVFRIINEQTGEPADDIIARVLREGIVAELANHTSLVRRDGTNVPIEDSAAPIRDGAGNVAGAVLVFHDVAEKRRSQSALQAAKEGLEKRVAERTADLSRTVDTLQGEIVRRELAENVLRQRSEQLRALAAELTLAEHRERRRLAEVLHDNLQQLLVGAKFQLDVMSRRAGAELKDAANGVLDLLDESIECSRTLTVELSPPVLHKGGLSPALGWLATWMQQKHALTVELDTDEKAEPQSEQAKILLFQSARELLFNTVKHAGVNKACVRLRRTNEHVELVVSDQGEGFNPEAAMPAGGGLGGFGLFSIRERLDLLGGRLEIDSAPGRGSRFRMLVPVAPAAAPGGTRQPEA